MAPAAGSLRVACEAEARACSEPNGRLFRRDWCASESAALKSAVVCIGLPSKDSTVSPTKMASRALLVPGWWCCSQERRVPYQMDEEECGRESVHLLTSRRLEPSTLAHIPLSITAWTTHAP